MKKLFTAIVAALIAAPSFAQISSGGFDLDKENLYYGVRLGFTVANLGGDNVPMVDTGAKVGLTVGGIIGLRLSSTTPVFLESGLYYTERGAKNTGYSNLEIPLLVKYGLKVGDKMAFLPFLGPYVARACWGKTKLHGTGEKVGTFDEKEWDGLNRVNVGIKLGCGFEYNILYVEAGYQFGINNISKCDDRTYRSNGFFTNFGVNF